MVNCWWPWLEKWETQEGDFTYSDMKQGTTDESTQHETPPILMQSNIFYGLSMEWSERADIDAMPMPFTSACVRVSVCIELAEGAE